MPLWSPGFASRTGLTWFPADAIAGVSNGGALAQWDDRSGNGAHATQTVAGDKPIYRTSQINSLPAVDFVSTDLLETTMSASSLDETIMAVIDLDDSAATRGIVGSSAVGGRVFRTTTARKLEIINRGGASLFISAAGISIDTPVVVSITLGATTWEACINGTCETGSHSGSFTGGLTSGLGSSPGGGTPFDGLIAEIIRHSPGLGTTARQLREGYLAHKYGLQAGLPGNHPYLSNPPRVPASMAVG